MDHHRNLEALQNSAIPFYFYLCDQHPKPASNDFGEQRVHKKGVSTSYPQKCFPVLRVLIPDCGMKISSVFLGTSAALLYYWIVLQARAREESEDNIALCRLVLYSKRVSVRSGATTILVLKVVTVVEC